MAWKKRRKFYMLAVWRFDHGRNELTSGFRGYEAICLSVMLRKNFWKGGTSDAKTHVSVVNKWHEKSDENLDAGRLKIRQWMKRAIQWFPRVRSDMFELYAAEKLLKRRYYCHQTSFSCEPYMLEIEKILHLFHDHHQLADILTSTASIRMLLIV